MSWKWWCGWAGLLGLCNFLFSWGIYTLASRDSTENAACIDSVRIVSEHTSITEHHCGPGQTLTVYPAKDEMAVVAICRCGDAGLNPEVTEL